MLRVILPVSPAISVGVSLVPTIRLTVVLSPDTTMEGNALTVMLSADLVTQKGASPVSQVNLAVPQIDTLNQTQNLVSTVRPSV